MPFQMKPYPLLWNSCPITQKLCGKHLSFLTCKWRTQHYSHSFVEDDLFLYSFCFFPCLVLRRTRKPTHCNPSLRAGAWLWARLHFSALETVKTIKKRKLNMTKCMSDYLSICSIWHSFQDQWFSSWGNFKFLNVAANFFLHTIQWRIINNNYKQNNNKMLLKSRKHVRLRSLRSSNCSVNRSDHNLA